MGLTLVTTTPPTPLPEHRKEVILKLKRTAVGKMGGNCCYCLVNSWEVLGGALARDMASRVFVIAGLTPTLPHSREKTRSSRGIGIHPEENDLYPKFYHQSESVL